MIDPDVTLWRLRTAAAACLASGTEERSQAQAQAARAVVIAELVADLDDWLCGGGRLPRPWRRAKPAGAPG